MRAIVKEKEGPGASLKDVPRPEIRPSDVLVRVRTAAICGTDVHIYGWTQFARNVGVPLPLIFGHEFSGEVVEVGRNVSYVKAGDIVAGETHIPCGVCYQCRTGNQHICQNVKILGVHVNGAFAEYVAVPGVCAWKLPANLSFDIGAMYESLGVAVHAIFADRIAGQSVVVFGCGPIGLFAIGLAEFSGATQVIAVDIVEERLHLARKMGATIVINAKEEEVEQKVLDLTRGIGVDVFVELSGSPAAIKQGLSVLRKGGRVSLVGLPSSTAELDLVNDVIYKEAHIYGITGRKMFSTWYRIRTIMASGKFDPRPVITDEFNLSEFQKAIELARTSTRGKILIKT